jgi:nucleoid-associated protein YgaU
MVQKDLKIGLILGLILVAVAVIKLATDPRLSPKARILHIQNAAATQESDGLTDDGVIDFPENENTPEQITYIDLQKDELTTDDFEPGNSLQNESAPVELNATNIQDREQPEPTDVSQYVQAEKIKTQRFHIVRKDQTLSAISRQYYGTANKWKKIFDANRDVIKDPNKINTGTKLIIPD